MAHRFLHLALAGAFMVPVAAAGEWSWRGPDGAMISFPSEEAAVDFLRTADVVASQEISEGINRTLKLTLEADGRRAHAAFRTVNVRLERARIRGKVYRDFRDSYLNECAAYRLSRLLGLDKVPPCAVRSVGSHPGSAQLWVEGAVTEGHLRQEGLEDPRQIRWARQKQMLYLFDALIFNVDRNLGNLLVDDEWDFWFIDHTRAFLWRPTIEIPWRLRWCERRVWGRLRSLGEAEIRDAVRPFLTAREMAGLVRRRDLLVAHFEASIRERGEETVLFDWPRARGDSRDGARELTEGNEP